MLKLPNSFCRYLKATCESVHYRVHERKLTHLTCVGKPCCKENTLCSPNQVAPFSHCGHQQQLFSSVKKRFRIKIPSLKSNAQITDKSMSEPLQPTLNHVSYGGGQFEVSTNNDNLSEWQAQFDELGSSDSSGGTINSVPSDFRVWEPVGNTSINCDAGNTFQFKVLSYNVLAQYLLECHPYLYTECSPKDLKWQIRASRLFDEIINLSPDILCFQEVQASHLTSFYSKFEELGYCGLFKQKTGHRHDGCAIYYKHSLFELKEHMSVEFHQPELPILNRDNIGVMVKLAPRAMPACPLVVATTHLLYNPKRTDVRLAQIQVFLAEIDRFAYYNHGNGRTGHLPIILTGDLNSTPDSAVIKLLDKGHVSASSFRDSSDWQRIGVTDNCQHLAVYLDRQEGKRSDVTSIKLYNSEYCDYMPEAGCPWQADKPGPPGCDYSELFNSGEVGHSLRLTSVYDKRKPDGSSEASTYQDYWVTVDYIYFSRSSNLRLVERLRLPTAAECAALGKLPNHVYGSDHLALAATFRLLPARDPCTSHRLRTACNPS